MAVPLSQSVGQENLLKALNDKVFEFARHRRIVRHVVCSMADVAQICQQLSHGILAD
jgi:hypothetical protein